MHELLLTTQSQSLLHSVKKVALERLLGFATSAGKGATESSTSFTRTGFGGRPQVMKPRSCGQRKGTSLWLYTVQAMVAESSAQSSRTKGVHEWITGTRIQATVEEQLHSHVLHKCKHVPFVATHVTAPKRLCRIDWASSVRKQSAIVFQKCDSSKHPHGNHHKA